MSDKSTLLPERHLKQLRMPTFLSEYAKMTQQCATEGVERLGCQPLFEADCRI